MISVGLRAAIAASASAVGPVVWGAIGTGANDAAAATPAYPSGISASTSKIYCAVCSGASTEPTPTMPAGWTRVDTFSGGDPAAYGADVGKRRVTIFRKDTVSGSESGTVTVSLSSGNTMRASIFRIEVPAGAGISEQWVSGADTSPGTSVSITASSGISWAGGGLLVVLHASAVDTFSIQDGRSVSASGVTFGTLSIRENLAVATGHDHRYILESVPVVSGAGSSAPTYSYTTDATTSGPAGFLFLRAT